MKTKIIASIAVVVAAVVAGVIFKPNDSQAPTENAEKTSTTSTSETTQTLAESGKKMAFSEFIKQGGAYKCTVNQSVAGVNTVGTTYINGGLIRGEYKTQAQGINVTSSLIVRDGYTYSWTSMAPTMGFKAKVAENTGANTGTAMSGSYSWNAEQIGDYSCEAWSADANMFVVPSGVTFREV